MRGTCCEGARPVYLLCHVLCDAVLDAGVSADAMVVSDGALGLRPLLLLLHSARCWSTLPWLARHPAMRAGLRLHLLLCSPRPNSPIVSLCLPLCLPLPFLYAPSPSSPADIKKEFDKKYGPTWHVVVGRNFGSYVTHETKHFIYFYLGQVAILCFKSG